MAKGEIFAKIYQISALVPPGKVATYGQLARMAGLQNGARVVGWAMMASHEDVPAHRVIRADGSLCKDLEWGIVQRQMLVGEGVIFCRNGNVDMTKCLWNPEEDMLLRL